MWGLGISLPQYPSIIFWASFFDFLASFGWKMAVVALESSGVSKLNQKVDPRVDLLGQPLSRNHVFKVFRGELPAPLTHKGYLNKKSLIYSR